MPYNAVAGFTETTAEGITGKVVKIPIGVKINVGYMGTKIADPGWRYIDSSNWLGAAYIEGAYTVYNNIDVFANYGYSNYTPSQAGSGNSPTATLILTTNIITVGARYSYPLWRWTVPYVELGIGSYIVSVNVSESQQSIKEQDIIVAPEIAAGFYVPLKVPTATNTIGVNIQCSFGLIRNYFVKPPKFNFGYLGDIDIDGQRFITGVGVSF